VTAGYARLAPPVGPRAGSLGRRATPAWRPPWDLARAHGGPSVTAGYARLAPPVGPRAGSRRPQRDGGLRPPGAPRGVFARSHGNRLKEWQAPHAAPRVFPRL
jgi:hypothetical protein